MNQLKLHRITSVLLLCAALPLFGHAHACLTSGCHTDMGNKQVVHAPVAEEQCQSCHEQKNANHPTAGGKDFALTAPATSLCFACHDAAAGFSGQHKHGPSASGACTTCHDPHDADHAALLRKPAQKLCLDCHADFSQSMQEAEFIHTAIRELDCGSCHLPHSSEQPKMLKSKSIDLCFDCHDGVKRQFDSSLNKHKALYLEQRCGNCHFAHFSSYPALLTRTGKEVCLFCHGQDEANRSESLRNIRKEITDKKVVHSPVANGECFDCHSPHGDSYAKLLKGAYPQSFYAPYRPDDYDFCFQCHEKELLVMQPVDEQTGFRNGTDNLHYKHVAREQKGRTCKACHSVHASDGEKLINPGGIPFGNWNIPIRFEVTENGGGCVPGCHRPMGYDRKDPVDNSKPAGDPEQKSFINYSAPK